MKTPITILVLALTLAFATNAYAIDYPTYKGPTQKPMMQGGMYSTADQAIYGEQQNSSFQSTSSYSKQLEQNTSRPVNTMAPGEQYQRSYSVDVAALSVTGGVTIEDQESASRSGVRRIGGRPNQGDLSDPDPANDMPVGDTPWLFMALLLAAFAVYRVRKVQTK